MRAIPNEPNEVVFVPKGQAGPYEPDPILVTFPELDVMRFIHGREVWEAHISDLDKVRTHTGALGTVALRSVTYLRRLDAGRKEILEMMWETTELRAKLDQMRARLRESKSNSRKWLSQVVQLEKRAAQKRGTRRELLLLCNAMEARGK